MENSEQDRERKNSKQKLSARRMENLGQEGGKNIVGIIWSKREAKRIGVRESKNHEAVFKYTTKVIGVGMGQWRGQNIFGA